ncbi:MAG: endonuclease I family protein [Bdellovibrionales bacterium]
MSRVSTVAVIFLGIFAAAANASRLNDRRAYYPEDFYQDIENGTRDRPLKNLLFTILSSAHIPTESHDQILSSCDKGSRGCYHHLSLGYTRARQILFGELHLLETRRGYAIKDVYCNHTTGEDEFSGTPPGPGQIPDHSVLNAEHTWPQSRFTSKFDRGMQRSDLHILYPVLSKANSSRGNLEFGDVVSVTSAPCTESRRGYVNSGSHEQYFEVPTEHKGNAARAVFYFSVRYKLAVSKIEEDSLKAWHRTDPVDELEQERNEAIFEKQRDRNPFIDHPELVELIADF